MKENEYHIEIDFDLEIKPRTPFKDVIQELHIRQAETWLKYSVHKLIKALEEKLNREFDPEDRRDFGIKKLEITTPTL